MKCVVFLNTYQTIPNHVERVSNNLSLYIDNLLFLFRFLKSSQESFEVCDDISKKAGFLFDKELLFEGKQRIAVSKIQEFVKIISQIFRKTLKNLPENEALKFEIVQFFQKCEEILVSDQKYIEILEKDEKKRGNLLITGLLHGSDYLEVSLLIKKETLKTLNVFCLM